MRPVIVPLGITKPCTLSSERNAFTHESICAMRFCKVKYSPISFASGIFFILINILSSTIGLPVGVNLLGFHPKSCKYSPICLRDPRLNSCRR